MRWRRRGLLLVLACTAFLGSQAGVARTTTGAHHALRPKPHQHVAAKLPLIVIDAGHGGRDPGAVGVSGTMEKTITLATAEELRRTLQRTGRYRVAMTRTRDSTVSLGDRLAFAREHEADLLIAIHADASPDRTARGASVYVSTRVATSRFAATRDSSGNIARALAAADGGSVLLQNSMIEQLADDVRMTESPARQAHLYVLGSRTIPSVLLELGFLSNRQDEALLRKPAQRGILVRAISDAIDDYFAAVRQSPART